MELRKICDDTSDMGIWELAHNMMFVKNREAWYRDFEREIPLRNLIREILAKHVGDAYDKDFVPEAFDEAMAENLQYGTEELDGVIATLYTVSWGAADLREWLKRYEENGLPATTHPEVLKQAVSTWGKDAQVDMAIEEMSELTKALLKERRATHYIGPQAAAHAQEGIYEEMADVIIMLMQLLMIFGDRGLLQKTIDEKIKRLTLRLNAAQEAGADAAQGGMQPAT